MKRWTQLVHFNPNPGDPYHPNCTPIYQTATFAQKSPEMDLYDYTRSGNPTRTVLEQQLARLEGGTSAFTFASGMAALTAIIGLLSYGDHIIAGDDLYGGTHRLLSQRLPQRGLQSTLVDTTDLNAVANALRPETRMILIETPSNPLQKISDIKALAQLAHAQGAQLVVDNTFLSPWLQQPLSLGADIVIHSATKHLSGHSDVTAGVIIVNNLDTADRIAFIQNAEGSALAPFECWLLLKGLKTLGLRVERQQNTAEKIVTYLQNHPLIKKVYYPTLASHPGVDIQKRQAEGGGTVISFATGSAKLSSRLVQSTQLFIKSVSFGSLTSLISLPCAMSHASVASEQRLFAADLVRISIGIEDAEDLILDLEQAMAKLPLSQEA
ncbi:MAG TPA: PLP-dependent transferase [Gammaproteobacteria bacterium]|nr:PLP-dependent transferase [Gammaproteobacteria bacterium]